MKSIFNLKTMTLCLLFIFGPSYILLAQYTDWIAPKEADMVKIPFSGNADATKKGKKLYVQMCAVCHGDLGKGDGIAGTALDPPPGNFTSEKVQAQTDGALFWKMTTGRPPMISYKEFLTEEQRWQLVNYIRVLGKNK